MISLKELEDLDTEDKLEERAEELAGAVIKLTSEDIDAVYGENSSEGAAEHVYGLANVKASWMESLLIGRWIAEAKNEILSEIRSQRDPS